MGASGCAATGELAALVRGDKDWGNERNMARCEQEGMPYLFKLRLTSGVKRSIEKMMGRGGWEDAGQGWQGHEAQLRLQGWGRSRRVVMLRRRLPETLAVVEYGRPALTFAGPVPSGTEVWEFAVLVTAWIWKSARSPSSIATAVTVKIRSTN